MIADMSVAPEIAILAEAALLVPAQQAARLPGGPRLTLGTLARHLRTLAASPERWWGLVRFSPDRSVQIRVEAQPGCEAWLVVMPPGDAGRDCDCDVATLIAGEATEATEATEAAKGAPGRAVLRPGATRVHGQRHRLRGHGAGYSISLHARATPSVLCKVRVMQEPKALSVRPAPTARAGQEGLHSQPVLHNALRHSQPSKHRAAI